MSFNQLPIEIVSDIVPKLPREDLVNVCLVCKAFYQLAIPFLYESVSIKGQRSGTIFLDKPDEKACVVGGLSTSLLRAPQKPTDVLCYTRHFQIASPFHKNAADGRCEHRVRRMDPELWDVNWNFIPDPNTVEVVSAILPILKRFRNDQLLSFSWEIGACPPESPVDIFFLLAKTQTKLDSIKLITDVYCLPYRPSMLFSISLFDHLKRFSWLGISSCHYFTLTEFFSSRSSQLQELELGALKRSRQPEPWGKIFGIEVNNMKCLFTSLKVLSLTDFQMTGWHTELASAFGLSGLHKLKLGGYPFADNFFSYASLSPDIQLKSLELYQTEIDIYDKMIDFLLGFQGLEELFISVSNHIDDIMFAAVNHNNTLKRLVLDRPETVQGAESSSFVCDTDLPLREHASSLRNPLARLDHLEFLGISCSPRYLSLLFGLQAIKPPLQFLHIRTTREYSHEHIDRNLERSQFPGDFNHFCEWIFSPKGAQSLRVLAIGNFSFGRNHSVFPQKFICRNERSVRIGSDRPNTFSRLMEEKGDPVLWALVEGYSDALAACPDPYRGEFDMGIRWA